MEVIIVKVVDIFNGDINFRSWIRFPGFSNQNLSCDIFTELEKIVQNHGKLLYDVSFVRYKNL